MLYSWTSKFSDVRVYQKDVAKVETRETSDYAHMRVGD
jgi:hypothetical protein